MDIVVEKKKFSIVENLKTGDKLKIGKVFVKGKEFEFAGTLLPQDMFLTLDYDNLKDEFSEVNESIKLRKENYNASAVGHSMSSLNGEADEKNVSRDLFLILNQAYIQLQIMKSFEDESNESRLDLMKSDIFNPLDKIPELKLSDILKKGMGVCSEYSAFVMKILQDNGFESYLCTGKMIDQIEGQDVNQYYNEQHHFLFIKDGENIVLHDPLNSEINNLPMVLNTGLTEDGFYNYIHEDSEKDDIFIHKTNDVYGYDLLGPMLRKKDVGFLKGNTLIRKKLDVDYFNAMVKMEKNMEEDGIKVSNLVKQGEGNG